MNWFEASNGVKVRAESGSHRWIDVKATAEWRLVATDGEINALREYFQSEQPVGAWAMRVRVAAAMYAAPDPNDEDAPVTPWPPKHPDDFVWWWTRADAAINAMKDADYSPEDDYTPTTMMRTERSVAVWEMAFQWHAASDHAKDGTRFGAPPCNCKRVAERAYDLGWMES